MITNLKIANYGPIRALQWKNPGRINLVIGENGSGKSFFLKALYAAVRSAELFKRGDDKQGIVDILNKKLFWTFQTDNLIDLISKAEKEPLHFSMYLDRKSFSFVLSNENGKPHLMARKISGARDANSVFLPAKEVLTLFNIILQTRLHDQLFGFDDTYLDLALALQKPTGKGKNFPEFAQSRKELEAMLGGKVKLDPHSNSWFFVQNKIKYPMGVTAEGIKKIAILDTLLGNKYLNTNSIIFIDEPESALHPKALVAFLDIIAALAGRGIQFFIASHSYFVIKKLYLIARKQNVSIPVQSIDDKRDWQLEDLLDGMPENPIIDESVRLYDEEVRMAFE